MKMLLVAVVAALMMVSGCATRLELADAVLQARKSGREGVAKVYPVPSDQAWEIARSVLRWLKTDEVEERRAENCMIAGSGMKMALFGTVMGVWIEPDDPGFSRITVISRNRNDCCVLTDLTPDQFFRNFEKGMNIIKGGGMLPVAAP